MTDHVSGQGMLALSIRDISSLHAAYMPFIRNGGLMVPTTRNYQLGDEVFLLLHLMDEAERIPLVGTVVWITPRQAESHRQQGVGVELDDREGRAVKLRIESYLANFKDVNRPTQTL
jgi:type IV pilus assembly protein PilZ